MTDAQYEALGRETAERLGIQIKHYPAFHNKAGKQPAFWAFYNSPGWMNCFMTAEVRHGSYGNIERLHRELGKAAHACWLACDGDGKVREAIAWAYRRGVWEGSAAYGGANSTAFQADVDAAVEAYVKRCAAVEPTRKDG